MSGPSVERTSSTASATAIPEARIVARRSWVSWAWMAPLLALLVVGALVYEAIQQRGTPITITFHDGRGLSANDPVNCRGVQVGVVERVRLAPDLDGVVAHVRLYPDAEALASAGTEFWIVRPEVSLRGVTGLDALLGPQYIEVAPAPAGAARRTHFAGLESPLRSDRAAPGSLNIVLLAPRRGSITVGSPVTYRDMRVGSVLDIRLADDSTRVEISAAIDPPYVDLVRDTSQFWNASGVGVDFGLFGGLTFRADSLEAILTGGIAFATPAKKSGSAVEPGHRFDLAAKADAEWLTWDPVIPLGGGESAAGKVDAGG